MKISTRIRLWSFTFVAIFLANAAATLVTKTTLTRAEGRLLEAVNEVRAAEHLKDEILTFRHANIVAGLTHASSDIEERDRVLARLRAWLKTSLSERMEPVLRREYQSVRGALSQALDLAAGIGEKPQAEKTSLRNPWLAHFFREALTAVDRLMDLSNRELSQLKAEGDRIQELRNLIVYLTLALSMGVLLWGLWASNRLFVRPLAQFIEVMDRIRHGDLTARWRGRRQDEIGEMGRTLNLLTQELEIRRRERLEFVASVAHDIRNPLCAISAYCDLALLKGGQLGPRESIKAFETIKKQTARLNRLTQDLMESAKQRLAGWITQKDHFCLKTLAEETLILFRSSHPTHKYTLRCSATPKLTADRDRIGQVLMNLISNAVKYSPNGSPVEVLIGATRSGLAIIEVSDRGIGIPDEAKARIYERFARLKGGESVSDGHGLGLSIVKEIITAHGGTISIQSRLGGGTTFQIILPQAQELLAGAVELA